MEKNRYWNKNRNLGLEGELQEEEQILEHSGRKHRIFTGCAFLAVGVPITLESVLKLSVSYLFAVEFVLGCVLLYAAIWIFVLCQHEFVCVTNKRILYRKCGLLGQEKGLISYPVQDVMKARLYRMSVMWKNRYDGQILLKLNSGKMIILPPLYNGQYVLDAIRESRDELSGKERIDQESFVSNVKTIL